jgi:hypothetical protein
MADYFTRISFMVDLPSETLAQQALASIESWRTALYPETIDADAVDAVDAVGAEATALPERLRPFVGECLGVEIRAEGHGLWVHDDGGGPHLDLLAACLQEVLAQYHPTGVIEFEWANDCSKPRLDAFGGGAVAIWSDDMKWGQTSRLLEQFRAEREVEEGEAADGEAPTDAEVALPSCMANEQALIEKHGVWGEHPKYPIADWKYQVENDEERRGYWGWVIGQIEEARPAPG